MANDEFAAFSDEFKDRRSVTILLNLEDNNWGMQIHHPDMNRYEALGIVTAALDMLRDGVRMMEPLDDDGIDDEDGFS